MTSQIIELKQEDLNTSVTINGNYECNITQNITSKPRGSNHAKKCIY